MSDKDKKGTSVFPEEVINEVIAQEDALKERAGGAPEGANSVLAPEDAAGVSSVLAEPEVTDAGLFQPAVDESAGGRLPSVSGVNEDFERAGTGGSLFGGEDLEALDVPLGAGGALDRGTGAIGLGPTIGKATVEGQDISDQTAAKLRGDIEVRNARLQKALESLDTDFQEADPETRDNARRFMELAGPDEAEGVIANMQSVKERNLALDAKIDSLVSQEIDPNRIFANGSGMAAALGVAAGALSQAILGPGTPNVALSIMESALRRDMEAQKAMLSGRLQAAGIQKSLITEMRATLKDEVAVREKYAATAVKLMQAGLAKHAAKVEAAGKMGDLLKIGNTLSQRHLELEKSAASKFAKADMNLYLNGRVKKVQEKQAAQIAALDVSGVEQAPGVAAAPELVAGATPTQAGSVRKSVVAGAPRRAPSVSRGQRGVSAVGKQIRQKLDLEIGIPGVITNVVDDAVLRSHFNHIDGKGNKLGTVDKQGRTPLQQTFSSYKRLATQNAKQIKIIKQSKAISDKYGSVFNARGKDGFVAWLNGDESRRMQYARDLSSLRTSVKQSLFGKALGDTEGESVARMSDRDIQGISDVLGGQLVSSEFSEDLITVITGGEIDGWVDATSKFIKENGSSIIATARQQGVTLPPIVKQSASSRGAQGGKVSGSR